MFCVHHNTRTVARCKKEEITGKTYFSIKSLQLMQICQKHTVVYGIGEISLLISSKNLVLAEKQLRIVL